MRHLLRLDALPDCIQFFFFLSAMNLLIVDKLRVLIEGFSTLPTFMGLFPSVEALMPNKIFIPIEGLTIFIKLISFFQVWIL